MSNLSLSELKANLAIDKMALDDEVIRQPSLFYEISEALTEAAAERDAAKEELATVDAEIDGRVRAKFAKGDMKATDKTVASHVLIDSAHEKAFTSWLTAKTKADKLEALKDAFKQRSYMLRDLVALYTANYYEESSVKPSRAQEASQYSANRSRISNARAARGK